MPNLIFNIYPFLFTRRNYKGQKIYIFETFVHFNLLWVDLSSKCKLIHAVKDAWKKKMVGLGWSGISLNYEKPKWWIVIFFLPKIYKQINQDVYPSPNMSLFFLIKCCIKITIIPTNLLSRICTERFRVWL